MDHILVHKTSIYKFKWASIIQSMFYYHNNIKFEINSNKTLSKEIPSETEYTYLNNLWLKE